MCERACAFIRLQFGGFLFLFFPFFLGAVLFSCFRELFWIFFLRKKLKLDGYGGGEDLERLGEGEKE